jgi:hypothetical protein
VNRALELMDSAHATRHKEYMKSLKEFEFDMVKKYSPRSLSSAETALTSSMVARRMSTSVLAFGVTTVQNGWKSDFQGDIQMAENHGQNQVRSTGADLREVVRTELKNIDVEKAAPKK